MRSTIVVAVALAGLTVVGLGAQSLTYSKGQNVAPAYEGWERDADGRKYFVFGYMNRNWLEELDIEPGPDNGFTPGPADVGQPTHFLPRRNRFVFRVPVPAGFTEKDELIWTITSHGITEKAWATIREDYLLDDVVKASETGALGAGTSSPEVRANKAPVVTIAGPKTLTVKVGVPLPLAAVVKDDGVPRRPPIRRGGTPVPPTRITVGKTNGLHFGWFVFRGKGAVQFSPDQVKSWEDTRAGANSPWAPLWAPPDLPTDGRLEATATFAEPGTYVLRGLADDGALTGGENVTVTVSR